MQFTNALTWLGSCWKELDALVLTSPRSAGSCLSVGGILIRAACCRSWPEGRLTSAEGIRDFGVGRSAEPSAVRAFLSSSEDGISFFPAARAVSALLAGSTSRRAFCFGRLQSSCSGRFRVRAAEFWCCSFSGSSLHLRFRGTRAADVSLPASCWAGGVEVGVSFASESTSLSRTYLPGLSSDNSGNWIRSVAVKQPIDR